MVSASKRVSSGLLLHSLSSANPNGASASGYRTRPTDLDTELSNSHITVLIESAVGLAAAAGSTSFSYLAQVSVARFRGAARHAHGTMNRQRATAARNLIRSSLDDTPGAR